MLFALNIKMSSLLYINVVYSYGFTFVKISHDTLVKQQLNTLMLGGPCKHFYVLFNFVLIGINSFFDIVQEGYSKVLH